MDVMNLSKKKLTNAQPAMENTPIEQAFTVPEASETVRNPNNGKDSCRTETVVQPEPKSLTTEERLAAMEQALNQVDKNFQQIGTFIDKMAPLIQLADKVVQQQQQPPTPPTSGGAGALEQLLPQIMQAVGGAGNSGFGDEITKKVMEAGLNQMFAGTRLLEAMQTKMLANMGAKVVEDVARIA
jgi:aspartate aminotransferase-like enzyme